MISDDTSKLFGGDDRSVLRMRQGTILTWDPETGTNTVEVAGGILTNVPIQNTGEAISLKPGHVVNLNGQGNTWWIVGRITTPGSADFASASVAFDGAYGFTTNFAITTTRVTKVTATLDVPAWADEAVVSCVVNVSLRNPGATATYVDAYAAIDGVNGVGQRSGFAPLGNAQFQDAGSIMVGAQSVITSPGSTILCEGSLQTITTNWATSADQMIGISATAIYRSTV